MMTRRLWNTREDRYDGAGARPSDDSDALVPEVDVHQVERVAISEPKIPSTEDSIKDLAHTYAVTDEVGVYRLRSVAKAEDTLVKY
jgi:hypothetical protein